MKKGVFFTIDSIIAAGIIFSVVVFTSSIYAEGQPIVHLTYLSKDLVSTLSAVTVRDIDNEYINERINSGDITNLDNTVLEQIAEFWATGGPLDRKANRTASNVTEGWVPSNTGFGLWINNEAIYTRDMPIKKSLVSSKKIISGIEKGELGGLTRKNPPALFGPVIVEVRVWQ